MKKLINSKLLLQVIIASMVATLATAGIVGAATTIGSNINTGGTLTATGATTIYGATSIGGALTATSTLAVSGTTTLGDVASSTKAGVGMKLNGLTVYGTVTADSFVGALTGNASTATAATSATSATTATNLAGGAANQIAYQTGAGATSFLTAGTDGQLLVANVAGLPVFVTLGTDATISNAGALTIANGAVTTAKAGTDLSASNLAAILTFADGDLVDISAINGSSAAEGLKLPQATDCSAQTAEGLICWDSDTDALYLGNGAAAVAITNAFGATIDNAEITADTIDFTAIADALTLDVETTIAAAGALNLLIGDNVTLNKTGTGVITATTAGTVTTAAQPTITSVGTLTGLTMGGTLAMGANNITGTGSLGATDAGKLTKGWFVDVESTNMPTVGGTSIASTFAPLANPTFTGTLNVGGYATTTSSGIIMPAQQITTNIGCETATVGGLIFNNAKKILCICVGTSWQAATSTTPTACF